VHRYVTRQRGSARISDRWGRLLVSCAREFACWIYNINKISLYALLAAFSVSANADPLELILPNLALSNVPTTIAVSGAKPGVAIALEHEQASYRAIADLSGWAEFSDISFGDSGKFQIQVTAAGGASATGEVRVLPGWVSVAPPLIAILIALTLRSVIPALLVGIWFGATALRAFSLPGAASGLMDSFQVFVTRALADADHAAIILFSMMIGGMVGIITRNGGMTGIVSLMVKRATTAVSGQVSVWLMGVVIFFDDYSNTLVVGNTARPLTDRLLISREKLAYIVDSTAAPVASIALITTWIGYEVGLIGESLAAIPEIDQGAYTVFLQSIPYSFYPILAVVFVFVVAAFGRDMGPMYKAEVRARAGQVSPINSADLPNMQGENLDPKSGVPQRAVNAFVPLAVLIVSLIVGLYMTGEGETLTDIIGSADAYKAMMWASFAGALTAASMTIGQKLLTTHETVDAWYGGARAMLLAMIVLILAWSLSSVTEELHTAQYLVSILADSLPVTLVPAAVFVLSAITAFTTGTSWGTMGILMPLVIPLSWAVLGVNDMQSPEHMHIMYSAIASNLAGAVWGDHCSPISDTTVLSSMASSCDHIEHVRTQIPYAVLVATVGLAVGTIPGGYGLPPLISIVLGIALLVAILRLFGRRADDAVAG
jgi:Na+/H+ antiporter NhaC